MTLTLLSSALIASGSGPAARWSENLRIDSSLECVVHVMAERSPTFRRQLTRLALRQDLIVTIHPHRDASPAEIRARTRFLRDRRELRGANVLITLGNRTIVPELIAHELEHIVEQLDEVDLSSRADADASGVTRGPHGALFTQYFETERARQVGRRVAREVGPIPRCEGPSS